jgi:hypothetical protein
MSDRDHDIFTARGITPPWERGGRVAKAQGFERYEGADWRERLERLTAIDRRWGDGHPDPDDAYNGAREKLLHKMLGPRSAAARDYDGPTYDDAYLEIRAFAPIRERRSHKTQARLHFDATGQAPDDVVEALKELDREKVAATAWRGWLSSALAVDGWAMPRHAVVGDDLLTQIRPDSEVNMGDGPAKYVYTPGRTAKGLATNPRALELPTWGDPEALFVFALEGTLKMCAVVEAGYPAIDAGSVTLWGGGYGEGDEWESRFVSDLEEFSARHLVGRPVAVVVDSDWRDPTKDVLLHARKVTNVLRRAGAVAIACAPPEPPPNDVDDKWGVDDWLGKALSRRLSIEGLAPFKARHAAVLDLVYHERPELLEMPDAEARLRAELNPQAVSTALAAVRDLASRVDVDGHASAPTEAMAERMGVDRKTVWRSLGRAVEAGVILRVAESVPEHVNGQVRERPALYHVPGAPTPVVRTLGQWLTNPQVRLEGVPH